MVRRVDSGLAAFRCNRLKFFASRAGWAPHVLPSLHSIRACPCQTKDRMRSRLNMLGGGSSENSCVFQAVISRSRWGGPARTKIPLSGPVNRIFKASYSFRSLYHVEFFSPDDKGPG